MWQIVRNPKICNYIGPYSHLSLLGKPFRVHVDSLNLQSEACSSTQLDDNRRYWVISSSLRSRLLCTRAILLIRESFCLSLSFLICLGVILNGLPLRLSLTSPMLKHFFNKPKMSRKETRWLETIENFEVLHITSKKEDSYPWRGTLQSFKQRSCRYRHRSTLCQCFASYSCLQKQSILWTNWAGLW